MLFKWPDWQTVHKSSRLSRDGHRNVIFRDPWPTDSKAKLYVFFMCSINTDTPYSVEIWGYWMHSCICRSRVSWTMLLCSSFSSRKWRGTGAGDRENRGREGYGRRERKGREAREKFKKASFRYLLLLTSSQRNGPNNVSWLPFIVLRGLKQNLYARKVKKRKFVIGIKKTALLPVKLETFPSRLHHRTWMRWHDTCTRVSTVSVVSVSRRKNNTASQLKCRLRPFWSVSVFFGLVGKNPSTEDLPGSSLRRTVVPKTLKILLRGVNLCRRNAASMIELESANWFDLQHNFLFWTKPKPY